MVTQQHMSRGLQVVLLAMVLGLMACSADADMGGLSGAGDNCEAKSDCPAEQICRDGFCSEASPGQTTLNLRFIPPGSSTFLPQYVEGASVSLDQRTGFRLKRGITVTGGNGTGDNNTGIVFDDGMRPSGSIIFRPYGLHDNLFVRETEVDAGAFSADISPGHYAVTFFPRDRSAFPPVKWPNEHFTSDAVFEREISSDYVEISGTLVREESVGADAVGVANAQVYATSADGDHSSTQVVTDEDGKFLLKVEPDTGVYDVRVVPAFSEAFVPSKDFHESFEVTESACIGPDEREANPCRVRLSLGAYPSQTIAVPVKLVPPSQHDGDINWESTSLVVRGPLGEGEFRRKYSVDADGRADIEVYPSTSSPDELISGYSLEVIPPVTSSLARKTIELDDSIEMSSVNTIELNRKRRLDGLLVDSLGEPVSAAKLEFRLASDESSSSDARSLTVNSDPDGAFEVWLEPAAFDVLITPSASSGQPRVFERIDADVISNGDELIFELPEPRVVLGSIIGAPDTDGEQSVESEDLVGIGEVTVEVYRVIRGRSVVLGQARSDAEGNFRMAISSEL
jgi:hypothetical protein